MTQTMRLACVAWWLNVEQLPALGAAVGIWTATSVAAGSALQRERWIRKRASLQIA